MQLKYSIKERLITRLYNSSPSKNPYLLKMKMIVSIFFCLLIHSQSYTQGAFSKAKQLASNDSARLVTIFKDLHQNPELGFMEVRTSGIVAKELQSLGYQVITGIAKTGVVAILKNGRGPTVMYRADMDCNAVKETTGLPYASTKTMTKDDGTETPVMHACGHDAHITWMLGVAKIMMALKNEWKGTLIFLAQPAEELVKGAQAMVDDSLYSKGIPIPDYLFGMHSWPLPLGTIENGAGERMAGTDQLDVIFHGVGGHGASPEFTKDPIVMASSAVMQYQTIISRNIPPQRPAVLTIGAFQAGSVNNVIPSSALLKLNLRWFNDTDRNTLINGIKQINEGIAVANNLPKELYPTITMKGWVRPLVNNANLVKKVNNALTKVVPDENILKEELPKMGSEDFPALATGKTVYDFLFVGTANRELVAKANQEGKKYPFANHNGNYIVDLEAIPLGTTIGATALLGIFSK
jgi:hippurate hydrolase